MFLSRAEEAKALDQGSRVGRRAWPLDQSKDANKDGDDAFHDEQPLPAMIAVISIQTKETGRKESSTCLSSVTANPEERSSERKVLFGIKGGHVVDGPGNEAGL